MIGHFFLLEFVERLFCCKLKLIKAFGMKKKWFVVVNPHSGGNKTEKKWGLICNLLAKHKIDFHSSLTQYTHHATEITIKAIQEGYRKIIVAGGDGTYNEVINGLFLQKAVATKDVLLAMLPLGTGNDWIKTAKIPTDLEKAIRVITEGKEFLQDIGSVTYVEHNEQKQRYFLNIAGLGFDSFVANRMSKKSKTFGQYSYLTSMLMSLVRWENRNVKVELDDKRIKAKIFIIAVGICKYFASGMKVTPNAIPNDGYFDVTLIKALPKMGLIKNLKNIYDGSFVDKVEEAEEFRAKVVKVTSKSPLYIQVDGELLGHTPVTFEILPQCLKVMVPVDGMTA